MSRIQPFVAKWGCRQKKSCGMGIVVEYNMNTAVDVDGIGEKVEPRKRVMNRGCTHKKLS